MTGTPHGVGAARKPPVFLKAGDTVTIEIEKIGQLTNPVDRRTLARKRRQEVMRTAPVRPSWMLGHGQLHLLSCYRPFGGLLFPHAHPSARPLSPPTAATAAAHRRNDLPKQVSIPVGNDPERRLGCREAKPPFVCFMNLKNQGAGMPDGGLFTKDQISTATMSRPPASRPPAV